jgi:hypothetical protein
MRNSLILTIQVNARNTHKQKLNGLDALTYVRKEKRRGEGRGISLPGRKESKQVNVEIQAGKAVYRIIFSDPSSSKRKAVTSPASERKK